jgi:pimeloyl-ACP methyl ester carboxylesterase
MVLAAIRTAPLRRLLALTSSLILLIVACSQAPVDDAPAPTQTGMLAVAGGELHWESNGSGSAVVLLHGGLLDCTTWDREFERLAGSYRVVRFDARGHGRSSIQQGEYSHGEDLVALLDGLAIERAVLVGLSLGGRTAIDVAIAHPERVAGLVGVAPGMSGWRFRDPVLQENWQKQAEAARAGDTDGYAEWFLRSWTDGPKRTPDVVDPVVRERVRRLALSNLERSATASGHLREVGAVDRVSEIRAPTLALVGELDMSDIHDIVDLLVSAVPGARKVLVPDAGHMINLEAPEVFDRELDSFLDTLGSW